MQSLKLFAIVLPVFLLIDLTWLGWLMTGFYSDALGELARRRDGALAPRWSAAVLVYLLIPGGIVFLVRPMLGENATALQTLAAGALYGLIVYGTYDLTNLATLEKWTWPLTLADMVWGCFLCGIVTIVMNRADRWLITP